MNAGRFTQTHGHASGGKRSPTYRSWEGMWSRCTNHKDPYFHRYGGRGISIIPEWCAFEAFLSNMGVRPLGLTLERSNRDSNYEPSNCVWATRQQQSINRGMTVWFEIDGETQHLAEWCRRFGISPQTASWRLKNGWAVDRAFKTLVR